VTTLLAPSAMPVRFGYYSASVLIQSTIRGNKIRRYINILKQLPTDIQRKVLFHMQENHLIERHHYRAINKVLSSKLDKFQERIFTFVNFYKYADTLSELVKLFYKYYTVMDVLLHEKANKVINKFIFIVSLGRDNDGTIKYTTSRNIPMYHIDNYLHLVSKNKNYNNIYNTLIDNLKLYNHINGQGWVMHPEEFDLGVG